MVLYELISWSLKGNMKKYEETVGDENPLNSTQRYRGETTASWNFRAESNLENLLVLLTRFQS